MQLGVMLKSCLKIKYAFVYTHNNQVKVSICVVLICVVPICMVPICVLPPARYLAY